MRDAAQRTSGKLMPYLELLPEREPPRFQQVFGKQFEKNRTDDGIEFNFRRIFAFAKK
jgi:trans-aconitate methyltransferase